MITDVAASIKARLLAIAKRQDEELELVLVRFACERFLFRLGTSSLRERCVLKGAGLLTVWLGDPYRSTRDIDLLATGARDEKSIRAAMQTICEVACPDDGLRFDLTTLQVGPIREAAEYPGQRAELLAMLGKARIRIQVDFGFGDVVVPGPEDTEYPAMLSGLPRASLRTYPKVTTLAEKFEAMVQLGDRNSRMKDFHDVWALTHEFPFDGALLLQATTGCFARRGTHTTEGLPQALGPDFYRSRSLVAAWARYQREGTFRSSPPADFEAIGLRVREFFGPIWECMVGGSAYSARWSAGGTWR